MMRFDDVTVIMQNINCSKAYDSSSSSSSSCNRVYFIHVPGHDL